MSAPDPSGRCEALIREAADWRLIQLLLECPDAERWRLQVSALAASVTDTQLREAGQAALAEAAEGVYHSVFGPGGPAPAREASYHDNIQLGYLMSELNQYYGAFSYVPRTAEALDHVAVEAGFLGYLRLKEAYAVANGLDEEADVARDAARRFAEDHLSRVAQPLAAALAESGISYLAGAASALFARTGPSRHLPVVLPVEMDECEVNCS